MSDEATQDLLDVVDSVVRDADRDAERVWPHLVELGLPLVGIPEAEGGSGGELAHLVAIVRRLGFHAVATPLVETAAEAPRELLQLAELVGCIEGTVAVTREHLGQREQFGGPLLDLPAVRTTLAEMQVEAVQAGAALDRSLDRWREEPVLAAARIVTAAAATFVSHTAHRLHGAIGLTQEHPLHHHTLLLWEWRDRPRPAHADAEALGRLALTEGPDVLWHSLTTPAL